MSPAEKESHFGLGADLESSGRWLFRHRGTLPLLLVPAILLALRGFRYPFGSHALDVAWDVLCLGVGTLGLSIRVGTVGFTPAGTSSRDTNVPKATVLNTSGMYSLVRHPLYLGNLFMWLAPALLPRSLPLIVIVVLAFWLYYERIMLAEEAFLRETFEQTFDEWARRTPTFFPALRLWRRPQLTFSWRSALRREYSGLFALVATLTGVEVAAEYAESGTLQLDVYWRVLLVASAVLYVIVRFLKRRTRILHVQGR